MSNDEHTLKLDLREIQRVTEKRPVLVVLQGQSIGLTLPVDRDCTIIGRGSHADIVLRDEIASRHHAEVIRLLQQDDCVEYFIRDMGSTNGTFLNGSRLSGEQLLQDGDKIKIGSHLIKFAMLDQFETEFQERVHQMIQRDELTGLRSRRSLFAEIDRQVRQAARLQEPPFITALMLDLDFFKRVNDGRGHLIGSNTIREVGRIIRDAVGSADLAARYGGEEYLAYIHGTGEAGYEIGERIRQKVENHPFPASTSDPTQIMHITISVGLATFPADALTALDLIQKADQALYRAKKSGRNMTCVYDPEVDKPDAFHPAIDASAIINGPADAQ